MRELARMKAQMASDIIGVNAVGGKMNGVMAAWNNGYKKGIYDTQKTNGDYAVLCDRSAIMEQALIDIKLFGFENPGRAYTCAKKAEAALNAIK